MLAIVATLPKNEISSNEETLFFFSGFVLSADSSLCGFVLLRIRPFADSSFCGFLLLRIPLVPGLRLPVYGSRFTASRFLHSILWDSSDRHGPDFRLWRQLGYPILGFLQDSSDRHGPDFRLWRQLGYPILGFLQSTSLEPFRGNCLAAPPVVHSKVMRSLTTSFVRPEAGQPRSATMWRRAAQWKTRFGCPSPVSREKRKADLVLLHKSYRMRYVKW